MQCHALTQMVPSAKHTTTIHGDVTRDHTDPHHSSALRHLRYVHSCGCPSLGSGTGQCWSPYQGSSHRPTRYAGRRGLLQSRHWTVQQWPHHSQAVCTPHEHSEWSRSHHTLCPRCCCRTPPLSPLWGVCH